MKALMISVLAGLLLFPAVALGDNGVVMADGMDPKCYQDGEPIGPAIRDPDGNWYCVSTKSPASGFLLEMLRDGVIHYLDPTTGKVVGWIRIENPLAQKK